VAGLAGMTAVGGDAVRLALAAPPIDQLETALRTLAGMLSSTEEDFDVTE